MFNRWFRHGAVVAAALTGGAAAAETYTAHVYSTPAGYLRMVVTGAGDNAMMTGSVLDGDSKPFAAFRTSTGSKIIHPSGWTSSRILDSWGSTYHCGLGVLPGGQSRALFWVGGGVPTDLHPIGEYTSSVARGGGGQLQAGEVNGTIECQECGITVSRHAGAWSRTASSFKRLHSLTHKETLAYGTDGTKSVGQGIDRSVFRVDALLWNSTTSMSTNLRPSGATGSVAFSVWGDQQGGYYTAASTSGNQHACIWANTAASVVDLNPNTVFKRTQITTVRNGLQVGYGTPLSVVRTQAIAWHGSAATWINLHSKLPVMFQTWSSQAEGIDNLGNVTGYVYNAQANDVRPCVWIRS
jgi:hypothetical protein